MPQSAQPNKRFEREREFHNQWARSLNWDELLVRENFEACTAIENQYALRELGDLRGKRILDLGCGAGETSVYFALCGAEVFACDVGDIFLQLAKRLADKFGVKLRLAQVDANFLPCRDDYFDFVYGNGILHHVNLLPAAREIKRVLKRGGKAVFIEPLPYNPVIHVYRALAKDVRTKDEKPLKFGELNQIKPFFSSFHHREFWLFSLLVFLHFFLIRGWHPSKVRYWKKVIEVADSYHGLFGALQALDRFVLRYIPFANYLCWNTALVVMK